MEDHGGKCPHLSDLFERVLHGWARDLSKKIFVPRHCTDVRSRFFSLRTVQLWNSLSEQIVSGESLYSALSVFSKSFLVHVYLSFVSRVLNDSLSRISN